MPTSSLPIVDAKFERTGNSLSAVEERVVSRKDEIILTWWDFMPPFVLTMAPGTMNRPLGVYSTFIPARGAQLSVNGQAAAGQGVPAGARRAGLVELRAGLVGDLDQAAGLNAWPSCASPRWATRCCCRRRRRSKIPTAPEIRQLAADMQDTLEDIGASGLAAPQVFVSKRVVVYRIIAARIPEGSGLQPRPWTVMVNPVITPKTQTHDAGVGALPVDSGPARQGPRFLHIEISYQDLEGKTHRHDAHSSWAALLQHECDHLDGVVYPMRMTDLSLLAYNDEPGPLAREVSCEPEGDRPAVHRSGRALAGPRALVQRYKVDPMPKGQQKSNREKKKPKKPKPLPAQPGTPRNPPR